MSRSQTPQDPPTSATSSTFRGSDSGINAGGSDAGSVAGEGRRRFDFGLPAVKGTMGGIESPRKYQHRPTASMSTMQGDPSTPTRQRYTDTQQDESTPQRQHPPPPNSDAPIFRTDPTMKTCFDTVPLPRRDELKRLFMA